MWTHTGIGPDRLHYYGLGQFKAQIELFQNPSSNSLYPTSAFFSVFSFAVDEGWRRGHSHLRVAGSGSYLSSISVDYKVTFPLFLLITKFSSVENMLFFNSYLYLISSQASVCFVFLMTQWHDPPYLCSVPKYRSVCASRSFHALMLYGTGVSS